MEKDRVLFIEESWLGSCARSLREALCRQAGVVVEEVAEDHFFLKPQSVFLRGITRCLDPFLREEFARKVLARVDEFRPTCVVVYKGYGVSEDVIREIRSRGVSTVNIYPDCSPHAHGDALRKAVGCYDLVISTKPYHPEHWSKTYGYSNRCVFVAQGYDPNLHYVGQRALDPDLDVVLIATWRTQYAELVRELSRDPSVARLSVGLGGFGWEKERDRLPKHWLILGPVQGRTYVECLRRGKICIAPVTQDYVVDGRRQPGDVETTRTYELAAANCFFIHQRTDFVHTIYDEHEEVPFFGDALELASLLPRYLSDESERERMATAAHRRAVPAYSLDMRAREILGYLRSMPNYRSAQ